MNETKTNNGWGAFQNKKKEIEKLKKQLVVNSLNNYGEILIINKNDDIKPVFSNVNPFRFPNTIESKEINSILNEAHVNPICEEKCDEINSYNKKMSSNTSIINNIIKENEQNKKIFDETIESLTIKYENQLLMNNDKIEKLKKYNDTIKNIIALKRNLDEIENEFGDMQPNKYISISNNIVKDQKEEEEEEEYKEDEDEEEEEKNNIIPVSKEYSIINIMKKKQMEQKEQEKLKIRDESDFLTNNIIIELDVFDKNIFNANPTNFEERKLLCEKINKEIQDKNLKHIELMIDNKSYTFGAYWYCYDRMHSLKKINYHCACIFKMSLESIVKYKNQTIQFHKTNDEIYKIKLNDALIINITNIAHFYRPKEIKSIIKSDTLFRQKAENTLIYHKDVETRITGVISFEEYCYYNKRDNKYYLIDKNCVTDKTWVTDKNCVTDKTWVADKNWVIVNTLPEFIKQNFDKHNVSYHTNKISAYDFLEYFCKTDNCFKPLTDMWTESSIN